jgi:Domain of unknown function (DUF4157)
VKIGHKAALPGSLRTALEGVFGEPVSHVRITEYSLYARMHPYTIATTRRRRIYLRDCAADFFDDPWLLLHEYYHVLKQWERRDLTIARYCLEWLRRGYYNNRFEVEARDFADRHLPALRAAHPSNDSRR